MGSLRKLYQEKVSNGHIYAVHLEDGHQQLGQEDFHNAVSIRRPLAVIHQEQAGIIRFPDRQEMVRIAVFTRTSDGAECWLTCDAEVARAITTHLFRLRGLVAKCFEDAEEELSLESPYVNNALDWFLGHVLPQKKNITLLSGDSGYTRSSQAG